MQHDEKQMRYLCRVHQHTYEDAGYFVYVTMPHQIGECEWCGGKAYGCRVYERRAKK